MCLLCLYVLIEMFLQQGCLHVIFLQAQKPISITCMCYTANRVARSPVTFQRWAGWRTPFALLAVQPLSHKHTIPQHKHNKLPGVADPYNHPGLRLLQVDTSSAILALYQHPDLLSEGCIRVMAVLQIMASRLKILLMPPGRGLVPPFDQATPADASSMAPVIMAGVWEERKADGNLKHRIRSVCCCNSTLLSSLSSLYFTFMNMSHWSTCSALHRLLLKQ